MNTPKIISCRDGWLEIGNIGAYSVPRTFDCGQCFRFRPLPAEFSAPPVCCPGDGAVTGIAMGHRLTAATSGGTLFLHTTEQEFYELWQSYLALDTDYEAIDHALLCALDGADRLHMERAIAAGRGIRILRQNPWEALCSFIISQNNNIPRIRKIIEALCEKYGAAAEDGWAFPAPDVLAGAKEEDLRALGAGFRAGYILDAAGKVASGSLSLETVAAASAYEEAQSMLRQIRGVGPKVAACTLLFGFGRTEAFPVDVWIQRVLEQRFPNGLDPAVFGEYAGIAQQYLFYYERFAK